MVPAGKTAEKGTEKTGTTTDRKEKESRPVVLIAVVAVVLVTSGFYGVVIDLTDEDVIVEFGSNKNCRIPMKKSAIAEVEKAEESK